MKRNLILASLLIVLVNVFTFGVNAQTLLVKGNISDQDGNPLYGAIVQIKEVPSAGEMADSEGNYSIEVKKGNTLIFSYIGCKTMHVLATKTKIDVVLEYDEIELLDEVVVTGMTTVDKHLFTGASTKIEACEADMSRRAAGVNAMKVNRTCGSTVAIAGISYEKEYLPYSSEEYNTITENRFKSALNDPLSTFSIDVDAASYSNLRRYINQGTLPTADAIRTEELINYFSYNYPQPTGNAPVKISAEVAACPWNLEHRLVKIGLKAKEIANDNLPASNLVFLIDVSGSMYGATRLELVKSSLKLLVNNLRDKDRVAIVVYSGAAGIVLPSTSGADKQKIRESLDALTAGGSTAGGAGIQLAYRVAKENLIKGGNNRVILCTDGDFNVGVSSKEGLESLIEKERKSGVFLTVLGYGMGNYKDNRMQTLAEKGNGNHAYIDNLQEANKVLVNEFGGTMYTVAKDVKLQIEFNPEHVQAYRLVGYESRLLNNEDFNDDTKDAGEMGAGHVVTAFYEVVPVGVETNYYGKVDELKYQKNEKKVKPVYSGSKEMMTIKLRYKQPDEDTSKKIEITLIDNKQNKVSPDFKFAAAVAMYGQLLRDSDFKGDATYDKVIALAKLGLDNDEQGYRREFIRLVETTKGLTK